MAEHAFHDDDDLPLPPPGTSREKLKAFVARRYSTRLHMSLILFACGFSAMISSWTLLHAGVHSMLVRYPIAISVAYMTFLLGVWTWLQATGLARDEARNASVPGRQARKSKSGSGDWLNLPGGGSSGGGSSGGSSIGSLGRGGGSFDGGGANASFAQMEGPAIASSVSPQQSLSSGKGGFLDDIKPQGRSSSSSSFSSKGSGFGLDIDGDGIVLLVLAGLLILSIFLCSGYLVWTAPDVLTEAAFGAALTGTLSRASANHAEGGWVAGVVKKTWWPFAIVLALSCAFAWWSGAHYPQAATFKQAIAAAIHSN